jgi:hypothetical protein
MCELKKNLKFCKIIYRPKCQYIINDHIKAYKCHIPHLKQGVIANNVFIEEFTKLDTIRYGRIPIILENFEFH